MPWKEAVSLQSGCTCCCAHLPYVRAASSLSFLPLNQTIYPFFVPCVASCRNDPAPLSWTRLYETPQTVKQHLNQVCYDDANDASRLTWTQIVEDSAVDFLVIFIPVPIQQGLEPIALILALALKLQFELIFSRQTSG